MRGFLRLMVLAAFLTLLPREAVAGNRWSLFANVGTTVVQVQNGHAAWMGEQVTMTEQVGLSYPLLPWLQVRTALNLAEGFVPHPQPAATGATVFLVARASYFSFGAGPIGAIRGPGLDAGIYATAGVALPLTDVWRLTFSANATDFFAHPTLLVGATAGVACQL